jgi:hypothetical protein
MGRLAEVGHHKLLTRLSWVAPLLGTTVPELPGAFCAFARPRLGIEVARILPSGRANGDKPMPSPRLWGLIGIQQPSTLQQFTFAESSEFSSVPTRAVGLVSAPFWKPSELCLWPTIIWSRLDTDVSAAYRCRHYGRRDFR